MKVKKKHRTAILISIVIAIAMIGIGNAISYQKVAYDPSQRMKFERSIIRQIYNYDYEVKIRTNEENIEERVYPGYFYFPIADPNFNRMNDESPFRFHIAGLSNWQEILQRAKIKNLDQIEIKEEYILSKLPLEHTHLTGKSKDHPTASEPTLFFLSKKGQVINYTLVDGRLADFQQAYGTYFGEGVDLTLQDKIDGQLIYKRYSFKD